MNAAQSAPLSPAPLNAHQLDRTVEVSRKLNSAPDIDQLLKFTIDEAADLTNAEAASIPLFDPKTRQLRFKATSGEMPPALDNVPAPIHNSIAGKVWQSNRPFIINDASRDPRWNPKVDQAINFRTGSILGVPMHDAERPVGALESINKREGAKLRFASVSAMTKPGSAWPTAESVSRKISWSAFSTAFTRLSRT
jgi:GAF domain-containing protein